MIKKASATFALVVVVVAVLVFEIEGLPDHTRLWREMLNAGHIPLFGILALALLRLSTALLVAKTQNRYLHYLTAWTATTAIGVGTELLQIFSTRDADALDFVRNIAGATCFLAIYGICCDTQLAWGRGATTVTRKKLVLSLSVFLLITALAPLLVWAAAYLERNYRFPQIVSFDSYLSRLFVEVQDAELKVMKTPQDWSVGHVQWVGNLKSRAGQYPGIRVTEPYANWSDYNFLRMNIYSEMGKSMKFTIRIHDLLHNGTYEDRFNTTFNVDPGANNIQIPIREIRSGPKNRQLDMESVAAIGIFATKPENVYTIAIDRIWVQ